MARRERDVTVSGLGEGQKGTKFGQCIALVGGKGGAVCLQARRSNFSCFLSGSGIHSLALSIQKKSVCHIDTLLSIGL